MVTAFKILATAGAVAGVGGGCGTLTWYLTKGSTTNLDNSNFTQTQESPQEASPVVLDTRSRSKITDRNSNTGNCKGATLTEDWKGILKQLNEEIDDEEDYFLVTCQNTNTDEDAGDVRLPNNWTGLFPSYFFLNGGETIRKSGEITFSMNTETAETREGDYVTTFKGNMIEEPSWLGKWDATSKTVNEKSITTLKVTSEDGEEGDDELAEPVYLFLNESSNSR